MTIVIISRIALSLSSDVAHTLKKYEKLIFLQSFYFPLARRPSTSHTSPRSLARFVAQRRKRAEFSTPFVLHRISCPMWNLRNLLIFNIILLDRLRVH